MDYTVWFKTNGEISDLNLIFLSTTVSQPFINTIRSMSGGSLRMEMQTF